MELLYRKKKSNLYIYIYIYIFLKYIIYKKNKFIL